MFARQRLIAARESAGITQTALADRSGLSIAAIQSYETGRRTPHADQLGALANALGVSADYLLGSHSLEVDHVLQEVKRLISRD